jgi:ubiquinone/menaquinone biosynthesis C-methylase UbiE
MPIKDTVAIKVWLPDGINKQGGNHQGKRGVFRYSMLGTIKRIIGGNRPVVQQKNSVDAYNLWAEKYDQQPGNLMIDLDERVFAALLKGVEIKNKGVADIGCGTGRHWNKILKAEPSKLTGFDVSAGMLGRLKEKFPEAITHQITDDSLSFIPDATYDVIVSTLTVAHIGNIEEALKAWSRILKNSGDIIITDFHPEMLAAGGKRSFAYKDSQIIVENFVHHTHRVEEILKKENFTVINRIEKLVDKSVKHYYELQNAMHVYNKFKDSKVIYGIHLKRA